MFIPALARLTPIGILKYAPKSFACKIGGVLLLIVSYRIAGTVASVIGAPPLYVVPITLFQFGYTCCHGTKKKLISYLGASIVGADGILILINAPTSILKWSPGNASE